jgi:hypothetical protein
MSKKPATIALSDNVLLLPEEGEAWLLDKQGNPIAKFYDGNLVKDNEGGNNEKTIGQ